MGLTLSTELQNEAYQEATIETRANQLVSRLDAMLWEHLSRRQNGILRSPDEEWYSEWMCRPMIVGAGVERVA